MLLPCPHCKKRFKLSTERIPAGQAKLRCPSCKGHFVVDTSPLRTLPRKVSDLPLSRVSPARVPEERRPPAPECNKASEKQRFRKNWLPAAPATWVVLAVAVLFVAIIGVLVPVIWKTPTGGVKEAGLSEEPSSLALRSPITGRAGEERPGKKSVRQAQQNEEAPVQEHPSITYLSMWPFSPLEREKSCEYLARVQNEKHQENGPDRCGFYAPWIAHLSLETSPTPVCELETVFGAATEAITRRDLCGRGYAFLSVY